MKDYKFNVLKIGYLIAYAIIFPICLNGQIKRSQNQIVPYLNGDTYSVANINGELILPKNELDCRINDTQGYIKCKKNDKVSFYTRAGKPILLDQAYDKMLKRIDSKHDLFRLIEKGASSSSLMYFKSIHDTKLKGPYPFLKSYQVKFRGGLIFLDYPKNPILLDTLGNRIVSDTIQNVSFTGANLIKVKGERDKLAYSIDGEYLLQYTYIAFNFKLNETHFIIANKDSVLVYSGKGDFITSFLNPKGEMSFFGDSLYYSSYKENKTNYIEIVDKGNMPLYKMEGLAAKVLGNKLDDEFFILTKGGNEASGIYNYNDEMLLACGTQVFGIGPENILLQRKTGDYILNKNLDTLAFLEGFKLLFSPMVKASIFLAYREDDPYKRGVIASNGKWLLEPQKHSIQIDEKNDVYSVFRYNQEWQLFNKKGKEIFKHTEHLSYTVSNDTVMLKINNAKVKISKEDGRTFDSSEPISEKKDPGIENCRCPEVVLADRDGVGIDSSRIMSRSCMKFNQGINKGKIVVFSTISHDLVPHEYSEKSYLVFDEKGRAILPKGYSIDQYSTVYTSTFFIASDKENSYDENYKNRMVSWDGKWLSDLRYFKSDGVYDFGYVSISDLLTLETSIYSINSGEKVGDFDGFYGYGLLHGTYRTTSRGSSTLFKGTLKNKAVYIKALQEVEKRNSKQIESALERVVKPEYEYQLVDKSLNLIQDGVFSDVRKIADSRYLVEIDNQGDTTSVVLDKDGKAVFDSQSSLKVLNAIYEQYLQSSNFKKGVVDFSGNVIVAEEYDEIKGHPGNILLLEKGGETYVKVLPELRDHRKAEIVYPKYELLGNSSYQYMGSIKDHFYFKDLESKDPIYYVFFKDGEYLGKTSLKPHVKRTRGKDPKLPKGCLFVKDESKVDSKRFVLNVKTGNEYKK